MGMAVVVAAAGYRFLFLLGDHNPNIRHGIQVPIPAVLCVMRVVVEF